MSKDNTNGKMFMNIFRDVFQQQGFVFNQINSYDNFLGEDGIKNILENMFRIHNFMKIDNHPEIKSIKIDVGFKNTYIEEQKFAEETIYDVNVSENKLNGLNFPRMQDINLPVNCRNFLRTLKVNVYSDIDISLAAYSEENGQGREVTSKNQVLQKMVVAELPLMMGSKFCSMSKKSIEERIQLQEDPLDLGGYFIIKGNEWSIDFAESYKFNELKLKNEVKNKLVSGFIISKNGDGFETSHQVSIIYQYKTGKILIRLEKYERIQYVDFPFYLIFKIFGVTNHIEMTEMITQDSIDSQNETTQVLKKIIQQACNVKYEVFQDAYSWDTPARACDEISTILNREEYKKSPVDKYLTYNGERIKDSFYEFFLSHLGQSSINSNKKMRFLGIQIKKVILAHLSGDFPDPHTYQDKRIHATGQNLAKQFKKVFNHVVVSEMKKKMFQELEKVTDIHRVDVGQIVQTLLSNHVQLKPLQKAIITGSGTELPKQGVITITTSIQSQRLMRRNEIDSVCQMRMVNNKKQSLDKQSKEIIRQRSVQPSFAGYICIVQSADNGEKAGKLKSLSSLSIITNSCPTTTVTARVWEVLEPHQLMYDIDTFKSKHVAEYSLQNVYVNGFWIGLVQNKDIHRAAQALRNYRRTNYYEWKYITVYVSPERDLYIYSDYGRILVPMIIVHYDKEGRPYHNITQENSKRILSDKATIDWYLEQQIFEYISVEEAHNCLVAETPEDYLVKSQMDRQVSSQYKFTHIIIPQSILGIVALLSPFLNHAQTKRITMFTNQAKQACGWSMFNYPFRMDKSILIQQYITQPMVKTLIHEFFPTNGQTLMVAYTIYDGQNQEDSVIANRGSVDQGLFNGIYFTYEVTQIKGQEDVMSISFTQPPNKRSNYTKLKNGIIQIGAWVEKEDVLVAKKQPQRLNEPEHDTSLVYKENEPARVEDVHIVQDEQDVITIRIKLKQIRNLKQGDKMSSGQGCKAVISEIVPTHLMPYTADQTVPDVIFNPHSIPTRMMLGQLIEATMQRICAEMCDYFDGTAFADFSVELIKELMNKYDIKDEGYKYLYNGQTGERMKAKVFIVPTFYYRLQKFAVTGKYIVDDSNKDILTRQPVTGRKQAGGSRIGEMEKDTLYSSCTTSILQEKFYEHSDSYNIKVCRKCGQFAEFNNQPNNQVYNCSKCKNNAEIVNVESSWGSLLFQQTIKSMGLDMKMELESPQIEQYQ